MVCLSTTTANGNLNNCLSSSHDLIPEAAIGYPLSVGKLLTLLSLVLLSCGVEQTNRNKDLSELCSTVVECGTNGYQSQSECEEGWLDNPEFGTQCAYDNQYLACADVCLDLKCPAFESCENECWGNHCL